MTGKSPFRHGIKDFFYTEIPHIKHPFRYRLVPSFVPSRERVERLLGLKVRPPHRGFRKCKAAWNILSDVGLQVGVLGWWTTWPAEEVYGHLLSDRFTDPNLPERWFPENLVDQTEVDALLAQISNPPVEDLQYFTQFKYDPKFRENSDPSSRNYMRNDLMTNLVKNFYPDKFRSQLGLKLLAENDYALFGIYFYGTDPAGHAFTRFKYPGLFLDVEPDEVDYFGKIIDKYYMWVDAEIGKYLEVIDEDTTVVLCSDHGLGPWLKVSSVEKGVRLSGSHRRNGIAIFYGKHIRKGIKIFPRNVLDVLPTVLYLIGLPTAEDMDGSVIKDAIDLQYLASSPPKTIKTYETKRYEYSRMKHRSKQSPDAREIERLRSLGYMN
jgi:predicted AlkP superfamily phosphohydrolase/phosphomutase